MSDTEIFLKPGKEGAMRPLKDGTFRFACHPGVPCFTRCCADLTLALTPYDVLRLKKGLGISSQEFLNRYTSDEIKENSGLPVLLLKMEAYQGGRCPFLLPEGCSVYSDRPGACRLYPVGRAARYNGGRLQERYFLVEEPHCLGFAEDRRWTVQEWLADQGLEDYNEMNSLWMAVNRDVEGRSLRATMTDDRVKMYFMACYNSDQFRRFVFESSFLKNFQIDKKTVSRIRKDDKALLKLGFRWLELALFGKKTMKVRPAVLKARKRASTPR